MVWEDEDEDDDDDDEDEDDHNVATLGLQQACHPWAPLEQQDLERRGGSIRPSGEQGVETGIAKRLPKG